MPNSSKSLEAHEGFKREGYAIYRDVLDPLLLSEASRHVEWLMAQNPGLRPELLDHELLGNDPFWLRLVSDPRLLDIRGVIHRSGYCLICVPLHQQATL